MEQTQIYLQVGPLSGSSMKSDHWIISGAELGFGLKINELLSLIAMDNFTAP